MNVGYVNTKIKLSLILKCTYNIQFNLAYTLSVASDEHDLFPVG
jgi:hypothetical protein